MIRILLCGEGPGDVGQTHVWDGARDDFVDNEGWLQPLVRKILGSRVSFESRQRRDLTLLPRDKRRHRPLPRGHGAKALMAKVIAANEGFDAVIFMADADEVDCENWHIKRQDILDGFERIALEVRSFACVPKATSESWLLADQNAWRQLGLKDASGFPANPEDSWGVRTDPNGNHPHQDFARACDKVGLADSRETRVLLAEKIDLTVLSEKCPVSFAAFQSDLTENPIPNQNCNCGDECCT